MKPTTLTKAECVRRARNLNQQAVSYREGGHKKWVREPVRRIRAHEH